MEEREIDFSDVKWIRFHMNISRGSLSVRPSVGGSFHRVLRSCAHFP